MTTNPNAPLLRPNILIIMTDQQRWDTLHFAGNADIQTPHLDAIARDGVWYAQSFCPFPVCSPSRYSFLSGLYVHQHRGASNRCTLAPGIDTFPRLLQKAGYRTHAIGKMHLTPTYLDVGFSKMELAEQDGDGRLDDDYHRDLRAAGLMDRLDIQGQRAEFRAQADPSYWETQGAQPSDLPEAWHSTTWIGDRAVRGLNDWDTAGGNLLMASFIKPHHPFDPPAPWDAMYDPKTIPLRPGWTDTIPPADQSAQGYFPHADLTEASVKKATAFYYASISQIDFQIGRMVAYLKERDLYDDTLILFTSDHGEYLGFHHLLLKSGPMYDPLLRVPLLIKFPHNAHAGAVWPALVSNVDIAPTLLTQAGIVPPPAMSGRDISGPVADANDGAFVFAAGMGGRFACRSLTHKLLVHRDSSRDAFFDLQADPLEMHNLINDLACQPVIAQHRDALHRWLLFDAPPPVYLDENAPEIVGVAAPYKVRAASRAETLRYFKERVKNIGDDAK